MADPALILTAASAALIASAMMSIAGLRAWSGWIELKRTELQHDTASRSPRARCELAQLRERVRRLEAIAAGVDF